ncbi:CDP-alcohol phosphatidyltransferase family protein [Aquipuribacter hungaricus]|uniref:CDP-alcohol phosphatidyltransferase family protein n=1 Tax=Aquipuribacter hungaricus TaxID=545624 RepID=A0ABV7WG03_9MICO
MGDRVLTLPNLISLARLLCVPVFAGLILDGRDGAALAVLLAAGASDFVDGQLARRWDQVTRLGQLLDPAADRLYVTAALLGLGWRGVLPWELVGLVVLREVVLTLNVLVLRRHGLSSLPPHLLGKAATMLLLVALPLLLLAETAESLAVVVRPVAWALVLWGSALYWWAGVGYLWQTHRLVAAVRAGRVDSTHGADGAARIAEASAAGPGVPRG